MKIETMTTYSKEIINEAARLYCRKIFAKTFFVGLAGILLSLIMIFLLNSKTWITGTLLSVSILACIIIFFAFIVYRSRSLAIFEKMESLTVKWCFTDDKFIVESDTGKSELRWNVIKNIIKSKNVWILVYRNQSYSVLPLLGVSDEALDFLSKKVFEN